jgi:hypothetical protein
MFASITFLKSFKSTLIDDSRLLLQLPKRAHAFGESVEDLSAQRLHRLEPLGALLTAPCELHQVDAALDALSDGVPVACRADDGRLVLLERRLQHVDQGTRVCSCWRTARTVFKRALCRARIALRFGELRGTCIACGDRNGQECVGFREFTRERVRFIVGWQPDVHRGVGAPQLTRSDHRIARDPWVGRQLFGRRHLELAPLPWRRLPEVNDATLA